MATIRIPSTPASAYNTDRPASSLLVSQIERLQAVVLEGIKTEGQAAEYIRALTRRVQSRHPHIEAKGHAPANKDKNKKKNKKKTNARKSPAGKSRKAAPKRARRKARA